MHITFDNNMFKASCLALSLSLSSTAHSALIVQDWMTAGDGYIIRDTDTNLEWLNLTQSGGLSYSYVSTQFGTGGQFEGMRYATNDEVVALWESYFGIDLSASARWDPQLPAYLDPGVRLASETLGTGIGGPTDPRMGDDANYSLLGITAEVRMDNGNQFVLGAQTFNIDTYYYPVNDPWFSATGISAPTESMATGSYLVRPSVIPVPAAVWLFGSGMIALVGIMRHKKH